METVERLFIVVAAILFSVILFQCLWLMRFESEPANYETRDDGIDRY